MKKVLVVGDIHNYEEQVHELIEIHEPDIVLDIGDHDDDFFSGKSIEWYFVKGNHENWEAIEHMQYGTQTYENLHLLEPGDTVPIEGITVTGLGGNFAPHSYAGKRAAKHGHITPRDVERAIQVGRHMTIDVLLMHESGKELWENTPWEHFGQEVCSEVIQAMRNPRYVFSGHYHIPQRKEFEEMTQVSLASPRNYSHMLLGVKDNAIEELEYQNESTTTHHSNKTFL